MDYVKVISSIVKTLYLAFLHSLKNVRMLSNLWTLLRTWAENQFCWNNYIFRFNFLSIRKTKEKCWIPSGSCKFQEKVLFSLRRPVKAWGAVTVSDVQIKGGDIQPTVLWRSQTLFEAIVPSVRCQKRSHDKLGNIRQRASRVVRVWKSCHEIII